MKNKCPMNNETYQKHPICPECGATVNIINNIVTCSCCDYEQSYQGDNLCPLAYFSCVYATECFFKLPLDYREKIETFLAK